MEIRSGYAFRSRPQRADEGGIKLVQMRDLDSATGWVQEMNLESIEAPANWDKHRLGIHDVLLAARGQNNYAAQFGGNSVAIPASNLLVLRLKPDCWDVHPFFLVLYLNLPGTQAQLGLMQTGSNIPFVPIDALKELVIPVLSNEQQQKFARLNELHQQEQRLMTEIQEKKKQLMAGVFQRLLTQGAT